VAALDAKIIDLLGEIKHRVAFDAEVEKSVEPLAAGVEVNHVPLNSPSPSFGVPGHRRRTESRAAARRRFVESLRYAPVECRCCASLNYSARPRRRRGRTWFSFS
jgi:hypothetical protein